MRIRVAVTCLLIALFCWQMARDSDSGDAAAAPSRSMLTQARIIAPAVASPAPLKLSEINYTELAKSDPMGLLSAAMQRYQNSISDYTCTFTKQERIKGTLGQEQQIDVRFREMPFSVLMTWTHNPDQAKRVLYVQDMWTNDEGQPMAKIEPQSAIARMLVKSVTLPINSASAKAASRRTIDNFGFGNALKLIIDLAQAAIQTGQGSFTYQGEDSLKGRKTWTFKRTLPYVADGGQWPDRVLIVQIDQEWLLPLECQTYADDAQLTMLAKYTFDNVHLNTGLTEKDFSADANGF